MHDNRVTTDLILGPKTQVPIRTSWVIQMNEIQRQIRGNGEACGKVKSTYFKGVKIQLKGKKIHFWSKK